MVAMATVVAIIIVWSAFSGPLDRRGITSAMVFMVAGLAVGASALGLLDVSVESSVAERVTEVALVLLLFSDATRLDLHALRHELGWPSRLLLIGLPLTMLAGALVAAVLFAGVAPWQAALVGVMLAPTDAALGQAVVANPSVPALIRNALNVESGLNDGLVLPFVSILITIGLVSGGAETELHGAEVLLLALLDTPRVGHGRAFRFGGAV